MLTKPKLCFSVGYFPIDSIHCQILFRLHYQDPRSIYNVTEQAHEPRRNFEYRAPNGFLISSASTLSLAALHASELYLAGTSRSPTDYYLHEREGTTSVMEVLLPRMIEALSSWGRHAYHFREDVPIEIDPDEPTAPIMLEADEFQKFVIP